MHDCPEGFLDLGDAWRFLAHTIGCTFSPMYPSILHAHIRNVIVLARFLHNPRLVFHSGRPASRITPNTIRGLAIPRICSLPCRFMRQEEQRGEECLMGTNRHGDLLYRHEILSAVMTPPRVSNPTGLFDIAGERQTRQTVELLDCRPPSRQARVCWVVEEVGISKFSNVGFYFLASSGIVPWSSVRRRSCKNSTSSVFTRMEDWRNSMAEDILKAGVVGR